MDFDDAASFFDDDPAYDGYTDELLFYCHTTPHDDHTSSGATARRRTMTTANGTVAPARHVLKLYGEKWLVGGDNPDAFMGSLVRRSYGLKKSTGLFTALTPGAAALSGTGTDLHVHLEYFRDQGDTRTSSDWDVMWNAFFAPGEPVAKGTILRRGSSFMRVRNTYQSIESLYIAEADQLDADALQSVVFTTSGTRDLVTDLPTTATTATTGIYTDLQKFYHFRAPAESQVQPGDIVVFVAKSAITPRVQSLFTMLGVSWRVLAVVSDLDAWALHARLA